MPQLPLKKIQSTPLGPTSLSTWWREIRRVGILTLPFLYVYISAYLLALSACLFCFLLCLFGAIPNFYCVYLVLSRVLSILGYFVVGLYFMYYLTPMGEFSACLYDLLVYFIHVQTSLSLILFVSTKIQIGKFLILRVFYCLRFCFMYVLARVGRQLNGLHGEWTGSDDLDRFLELQHLLDSTSRVNRDSLDIIPHEPNMPRACLFWDAP